MRAVSKPACALVPLSVNMMTYKMWTSGAFHSIIPSIGGEKCQEKARVLSHARSQNGRGWRRWHGNIRHRIETSSEPRLHCTLLAVWTTMKSRHGSIRPGKSSASGGSGSFEDAFAAFGGGAP